MFQHKRSSVLEYTLSFFYAEFTKAEQRVVNLQFAETKNTIMEIFRLKLLSEILKINLGSLHVLRSKQHSLRPYHL